MKLSSRGADPQIVRVEETRIDAAVAIQFKDAMRDILRSSARRVVLDLGNVEFIDSSGLGAIVAVRKALGPEQRLDLAELMPMVDRVFRLTRMDTIFRLYPSLAEAEAGDPPGAEKAQPGG